MKRLWLIPFLFLIAAVGPMLASAPAEALPASTADDGSVFARGVLEPRFYLELTFQSYGQVAEILVAAGDVVEAGAPLIGLDSNSADLEVRRAEGTVTTAEAHLATARSERLMAQAHVASAEEQVAVAEARLNLVRAGPPAEAVTAAQANLAAAEAELTRATALRDAALNVATPAAVRAAEAALAAATANRNALENAHNTIVSTCVNEPDGEANCPLYGPVEERTRAQLEAARAEEAAAQAALDQLRAGPTAAQRQAADAAVSIATANRNLAQAELQLLLADARPEEIARAEAVVTLAQAGVASAQADVLEAEAMVAGAQAQIAAAEATLARAQLAQDRLTLRAPVAGTIAAISVGPGESVSPDTPVATLADFGGWLVRTSDLSELDVTRVTPELPVEIRLDAIPDQVFAGTVTAVALTPTVVGQEIRYEATIRVEPASGAPFAWGMTAVLSIQDGGDG